jgi:hypothetical protein
MPIQVLWFDMEDIAVLLMMYVLWMVMDKIWLLPLVGLVPYLFHNVKAGKPRGFMRHVLYEFGFAKLDGYPPAQVIKFEE